MKILVTCPDLAGDLFYALPCIMQLGRHLDASIDLQAAARPALPLLRRQPYLHRAFGPTNQPGEDGRPFASPPWRIPSGQAYDAVYHLGVYHELCPNEIFAMHIGERYFRNLERGYGLTLPRNPGERCLFAPEQAPEEFIVFHGLGGTFQRYAGAELLQALPMFWAALFARAPLPVVAVCGPGEGALYDWFQGSVVESPDMLATAGLMLRARCFVGVESSPAALANGLKTPRLVLSYFGNASPTGERGASFCLDEPMAAIEAKLRGLLAHPRPTPVEA